MAWWNPLVSSNLSPSMWRRDSWMCLQRPQAPVKAVSMEQSSPIIQFHLSIPIRFWLVVISSSISLKWFSWCGGKDKVMLTVSITHPRRTWQVYHVKSPDIIFFSDKTSLRLSNSTRSQGRNTLSRRWNKVSCNRSRQWSGTWANPRIFDKNLNLGGRIFVGPPKVGVSYQTFQCQMEDWQLLPDNAFHHVIQTMHKSGGISAQGCIR